MVDAILEGCARVLVREGYDQTSTNRIAKAAGVSVGSLYQYFPNKQAVVEALSEKHLNDELAAITAKLTNPNAPIPELTLQIIHGLIAAHQVDPELHEVIVRQVPTAAHSNMRSRCCELIAFYLTQRSAEVRVTDPELAAFLVVEVVDSVLHTATTDRKDMLHHPKLIDGLVDMVVRYLLP